MSALFPVPQDATLGTPAHDDPGMVKPWTEDDVLRVLWRHFASQSWAAIPQVTVAERDLDPDTYRLSSWNARRDPNGDAWTDRRIDLLLARKPRKTTLGDLETLAVEVKVTRADFLQDVRNPAKQAAWRKAATRHTYAVPAGLVTADEVPEGSGLLAVKWGVGGYGAVEWVKRAPYADRHAPELPRRVLAAVMFRASSLEAHTRGWVTGPEAAGTPQELRAALTAAHKASERAEKRADTAEGKAEAWKTAHALATPAGHPCRWCGRGLKPLNPKDGRFKKWRHIAATDDAPCALAETAVQEQAAREAYDAATPEDRARQERLVQRWNFNELVEKEPWRAFLPPSRGLLPGVYEPQGPEPADVLPEGAE